VIARPRAAARALRVCLVRPPTLTAPRSLSYYGTVLPLGLAYVAAAVRAAGHHVRVLDGPGLALDRRTRFVSPAGPLVLHGATPEELASRVGDADVIGISHGFLHEWDLVREIVARVRRASPHATIVLGGENATGWWDRVLARLPEVDACVLGEGEDTFVELLEALGSGRDPAEVPGLALRVGGRPVCTPARARMTALDERPWPAWDLFDVDGYLARGLGSGVARGRSIPVLTSRGCPYRCTFCSAPTMWGTRYVRRDPARVVDEIEHWVARYRVDNVDINDLTAMLTKAWIVDLAREVVARGVRVTWQLPSGTRSEAVDAEAARLLVAAGCRNFCYAPESGSERTLRRIGKRVQLPALERSLKSAVAAGMKTHASIIVGFPGETRRDLWDTWRLCARMAGHGLHGLSVLVFSPYPGGALHRELRARGQLREDARWRYASLLRSAGGGGLPLASEPVRGRLAVQLAMLAGFHALAYARRPWRLAQHAWALARGKQHTVMDQFLATKLAQVREAVRAARVRPRHASPEPIPSPAPIDPSRSSDPRAAASVALRV
jgi:anaerobic magnesium-protoporphyrin IX monomethyl ester cyclase